MSLRHNRIQRHVRQPLEWLPKAPPKFPCTISLRMPVEYEATPHQERHLQAYFKRLRMTKAFDTCLSVRRVAMVGFDASAVERVRVSWRESNADKQTPLHKHLRVFHGETHHSFWCRMPVTLPLSQLSDRVKKALKVADAFVINTDAQHLFTSLQALMRLKHVITAFPHNKLIFYYNHRTSTRLQAWLTRLAYTLPLSTTFAEHGVNMSLVCASPVLVTHLNHRLHHECPPSLQHRVCGHKIGTLKCQECERLKAQQQLKHVVQQLLHHKKYTWCTVKVSALPSPLQKQHLHEAQRRATVVFVGKSSNMVLSQRKHGDDTESLISASYHRVAPWVRGMDDVQHPLHRAFLSNAMTPTHTTTTTTKSVPENTMALTNTLAQASIQHPIYSQHAPPFASNILTDTIDFWQQLKFAVTRACRKRVSICVSLGTVETRDAYIHTLHAWLLRMVQELRPEKSVSHLYDMYQVEYVCNATHVKDVIGCEKGCLQSLIRLYRRLYYKGRLVLPYKWHVSSHSL